MKSELDLANATTLSLAQATKHMSHDRFIIRDHLWIVTEPVGVPIYDFDFRCFFDCRTPYDSPEGLPAVARVGAFDDYSKFFAQCFEVGINLVHTPEDHARCSTLPDWYPLISEDTPRSRWYKELPSFSDIESDFTLPVFVKGARQTSKHKAAASIIRSRDDFEAASAIYRTDLILHWQDFVCRELIPLRSVSGGSEGKIPASYEFRTFWWRGELVGAGRYWFEADAYNWTDSEREDALRVARRAVAALNCAFLVVDLAQTEDGRWIVIECNDGMESGYASASPFAVWQAITDHEIKRANKMR